MLAINLAWIRTCVCTCMGTCVHVRLCETGAGLRVRGERWQRRCASRRRGRRNSFHGRRFRPSAGADGTTGRGRWYAARGLAPVGHVPGCAGGLGGGGVRLLVKQRL